MNGLKGLDVRDLDVRGFSPLVEGEWPSGPSLQGSWREGLGALRRRVNGLKGIGTRVFDVKGFKPTGGE